MSLNSLVSKLHKAKQTGRDRYIACCPAHDDNNPSLIISKTDDGKILVHCFSGCSVYEIVSAVGLALSDLFPEKTGEYSKPIKNPFPATDVLRCIKTEVLIVAIAACKLAQGASLAEKDKSRLLVAAGRIQGAYHE